MFAKNQFVRLLCLILLCTTTTCKQQKSEIISGDKLLAEVFNKHLYLSELKSMISENTSDQDSITIVNTYIQRWVREQLLMHEAERNIGNDLNIDDLVRNYRASLVRNNYEKILVRLQMDSTIAQEELLSYYEENKEQFQLDHNILRCYYMKVKKDHPQLADVNKWWESNDLEDFEKLLSFCSEHAEDYILDDSTWVKSIDILKKMPSSYTNDFLLREGYTLNRTGESYQYFLKVNDAFIKGNIAPLDHVEDQVSRVILHKRKLKLLDDKKEEIYDLEARRNNIKIYN